MNQVQHITLIDYLNSLKARFKTRLIKVRISYYRWHIKRAETMIAEIREALYWQQQNDEKMTTRKNLELVVMAEKAIFEEKDIIDSYKLKINKLKGLKI